MLKAETHANAFIGEFREQTIRNQNNNRRTCAALGVRGEGPCLLLIGGAVYYRALRLSGRLISLGTGGSAEVREVREEQIHLFIHTIGYSQWTSVLVLRRMSHSVQGKTRSLQRSHTPKVNSETVVFPYYYNIKHYQINKSIKYLICTHSLNY